MSLITTTKAAAQFGVTVNTIAVWIKRGKVNRYQEGEKWTRILVDADEVARMVKASVKKRKPTQMALKRSEASCNYCMAAPIDRNLPVSEITGDRRWLCRPCWRTDEATKEGRVKK